jgi:hypothetical protein
VTTGVRLSEKATISIPRIPRLSPRASAATRRHRGEATSPRQPDSHPVNGRSGAARNERRAALRPAAALPITNPGSTRDEYYRQHVALIRVRNLASRRLDFIRIDYEAVFNVRITDAQLADTLAGSYIFLGRGGRHVTIGLNALREALAAAGAPEDKANRAAEELAAAFDAFDRGLADFAAELKTIEGELTFLTWMMGLNVAMTAVVIWRLFAHGV